MSQIALLIGRGITRRQLSVVPNQWDVLAVAFNEREHDVGVHRGVWVLNQCSGEWRRRTEQELDTRDCRMSWGKSHESRRHRLVTAESGVGKFRVGVAFRSRQESAAAGKKKQAGSKHQLHLNRLADGLCVAVEGVGSGFPDEPARDEHAPPLFGMRIGGLELGPR